MEPKSCDLEFSGSILKEETIKAVLQDKITKTSVFEVQDAYPGYYQMLEQQQRPNFVYLLTKKSYRFEEVKRIESSKRPFHDHFDISTAKLMIQNKSYPSVRLKNLESYDHLNQIVNFLDVQGVKFEKPKKVPETKTLIKTDKIFWLEETEPGIYLDKEEKEVGYISLPKRLKWKKFETTTFLVKNNWLGKGFDAAVGHFNRHWGIEEIVRIYTQKNSPELLKTIREVYLRMI